MLTTIDLPRVVVSPQARSKLAYVYLLRVPIVVGAAFVMLPYISLRTNAASLLEGLFDVQGGWAIWTVATSAFVLALTLTTTIFLVVAYADERCGAFSFRIDYPVRRSWYGFACLLAVPTLAATFAVGHGSGGAQEAALASPGQTPTYLRALAFIGYSLLGLGTSSLLFWIARRLVALLDRVSFLQSAAAWLARHPELGAGYVDLDTGRFLPGHRLAAGLMFLSMALYLFIGWQLGRPNGFAVPTLAYVLLLLIIFCWAFGALAFLLDRYRVPAALPVALLIVTTGFRGGSDHYFQLKPSWATEALTPTRALEAHAAGTPRRHSAIVVAANGGGIQAAAWAARVLTGLAEMCRVELGERCRYAQTIRLISSVSGGTVGAMYFADAYRGGTVAPGDGERALDLSQRSSLAYAAWGLLYRDLFRPLYPHFDYVDRGSALEVAWTHDLPLDAPLESWRADVRAGLRPATIFNATISDSGERLLMGTANPPEAPGRRNFETVFDWGDVSIATAARLSAAFPYVSPAARADNNEEQSIHVVDGGYYDTYGVASLIDWLDAALAGNQQDPEEARIDRILVLQLRGAPPNQQPKGKRRGWFYQVYAPLAAMLGARDTGQLSHADQDVALLQRAWRSRVSISSVVFQFCGGSAPLSWHMTRAQQRDIQTEWALERSHASTRAVLDFLRADDDPEHPAGRSESIKGRCKPTPAVAERYVQGL